MTPRADFYTRLRRRLGDLPRGVLVATLLAAGLRMLVAQSYPIVSGSMRPGLRAGDLVLANKLAYGPRLPGLDVHLPGYDDPDVGDVIIFHRPHEEWALTKRVVGVAGDTLVMTGGHLIRNGVRVGEPYVRHLPGAKDTRRESMLWQARHLVAGEQASPYRPSRDNWGPIVVPPGQLFVLGDNRENSPDSRYWGFADEGWVRGRLTFTFYSYRPRDGPSAPRWGRVGPIR